MITKRHFQKFLMLLVVISAAAVADDSPKMVNEAGSSRRNLGTQTAKMTPGPASCSFNIPSPVIHTGSSIFNIADWNEADIDESLQLDGTADYSVEYSNKKESMNSESTQNDENVEWAAMKKLDFVIGKWEGEGWLLIGTEQRYPFSVTELYNYRCNGFVIDGEGRFQPQGLPGDTETNVMYGLGMIYYDRQSGEYRMWHYGGTGSGFVFTQKIEIDVERRALHYINKDARGETYKFGFAIDGKGILTARSERQRPDGTWYVSMEFRMRRVEKIKFRQYVTNRDIHSNRRGKNFTRRERQYEKHKTCRLDSPVSFDSFLHVMVRRCCSGPGNENPDVRTAY